MKLHDIIVTAVQSQLVWENRNANLHMFGEKLRALEGPCDLLVLPEMFTTGFTMNPLRFGEPTDGPTLEWMRRHAASLNTVITGSFIAEENGNYFNRLLWVRPDGSYEHYDKRHLFRLAGEDKKFAAGTKKLIVDLHGWKVCPLICYDLRFPVWSRNRWTNDGVEITADYDLLLYVANWPERRSIAWKTLLMARAIENLSYVVGLNRIGNDGDNVLYTGDSAIIDFKGDHIKTAIISREEIISEKLSYQELVDFRKRFPAGMDADEFNF
ncbi:MAG: amidohydrolase [Bacteroidota bacterium]|nr:amidohydrolase [Bacteroidota bacterium]